MTKKRYTHHEESGCECYVCMVKRKVVQNAAEHLPLNQDISDDAILVIGTDYLDYFLYKGSFENPGSVVVIPTPLMQEYFPKYCK